MTSPFPQKHSQDKEQIDNYLKHYDSIVNE